MSKNPNDGPPAHWLLGCLPEFRRDPLGFLLKCASYGDVVKLQYGVAGNLMRRRRAAAGYLLNHPDNIKHVLVINQRNYPKMPFPPAARRVFGQGLLTSEDPLHLKQRRMMQPFFYHQRIATYAQAMTDKTEQLLEGWQEGATVDVAREMMRLTLTIVCKALFSIDLPQEVDELAEVITVGQHHITHQYFSFPVPEFIPTRRNREFRKGLLLLNKMIYGMIHARRTSDKKPEDLLSTLLDARDQDGSAMSDEQIRDEVLTLFLAGHDTTANALAWTWYLLSQHSEVEARLLAELKEVLGGRTPSFPDLSKLVYTRMVFDEAMRIYPPVWAVQTRTALREDRLPTGTTIPAGADVIISPYVLHHNPRYFPDPDRFDPERFNPAVKQERPEYAYFPFSGGTRSCIGEPFARMEGILLLAGIAQRFKMTLLPGQTIVPEAMVTLRPKNGVLVRLSKRG